MAKQETDIQNRIRLALSSLGVINFRNHTGVVKDEHGRVHRFGLCKGSSDLIGYTPVEITQDMVGQTVAIFTSCEVKTARGRVSKEQQNFIDQVYIAGGISGVARSPDQAVKIIEDWKDERRSKPA